MFYSSPLQSLPRAGGAARSPHARRRSRAVEREFSSTGRAARGPRGHRGTAGVSSKIFAPQDPSKGRDDTPGLLTDSRRRRRSFEGRVGAPFAVRRGRASPRGSALPPPDARDVRRRRRAVPSRRPGRLDDVALQDLCVSATASPRGRPGDAPNDPDLHNFLDQLMRDEVAAGGGGHLDADPGVGRRSLSSGFFREMGDLGIPSVGDLLPRAGEGRSRPPRAPRPNRNRRRMTRPRARAATRSAARRSA